MNFLDPAAYRIPMGRVHLVVASAPEAWRGGVGEAGVVVVLGAICPWGRPHGPTVFLPVQRVNGPWTRPMSTGIRRRSSSSSRSASLS
jgi:hypothetical protein